MGLYNSRRWVVLIPIISTLLCLLLSGCNSTDDPIAEDRKSTDCFVIYLDNGEVITLNDTSIITIEHDIYQNSSMKSSNIFEFISRAPIGLREYGYDNIEDESDWKQFLLNKWEKYGVAPGIYIGKYVKVQKKSTHRAWNLYRGGKLHN